MVLKKGTRLTDNPKDTMIRVRMDKDVVQKLDECVEAFDSNRSDVIRKGIEALHDNLKKNK